MAGIYLHIPFCRKKCFYCDFYKTTRTDQEQLYLNSLMREAELRKNYLGNEEIQTIYFGGGTPSVLEIRNISRLLNELSRIFTISPAAEITLEANPDDLTGEYISELKKTGINRLSIGVQSFNDLHLKQMNRRHTGEQAVKAIEQSIEKGFSNLSIDLIFAIPGMTSAQFRSNLETMNQFPVSHLSAYYLTIHKGTRFYSLVSSGLLSEINEEEGLDQFNLLLDFTGENGFEHYEISNFARNGQYSRHNTSYWSGIRYLGLGPSAHSFDGNTRQWNVADLKKYVQQIGDGGQFYKQEKLSETDRYNELIMTSLRTQWGIDTEKITEKFGKSYSGDFVRSINQFVENNLVSQSGTVYSLTRNGIFLSDKIISALFVV